MNLQAMQQMLAQSQGMGLESKPVVEFRAGILTLHGTTVTADPRRGKLALFNEADGLKLRWIQRPGMNQEMELTLFPGDARFEKVPECKDGRVYLLRLRSAPGTKRFFWMQEPKDDKDEANIKLMNDTFTNPPPAPQPALPEGVDPNMLAEMGYDVGGMGGGMGGMDLSAFGIPSGGAGAGGRPAAGHSHGGSAASRPPAQAARPAANAAGASTGAASTSASTPSATPAMGLPNIPGLDAASLARALGGFAPNNRAAMFDPLSLVDVLDPENVNPILDQNPDMVQNLLQYLPEGQRTAGDLRQQLRSPQIQQALQRLDSVVSGTQYGQLLASLGLPVTGDMGVQGLVNAVEAESKRNPIKLSDSAERTEQKDDKDKSDTKPKDADKSDKSDKSGKSAEKDSGKK